MTNWLISGGLLLWGLAYFGLVVFTFFIATDAHFDQLVFDGRITESYAIYIRQIPGWVIVVTCAVALSRLGGAVLLFVKPATAFPVYLVSLGLTAVVMFRGFILADVASVIRPSQVVLEMVFLGLSAFAAVYAYTR